MSTLCSSFVYQQYIFLLGLVSVENVPCINFIFDILQHFTVTIGNDRITFTVTLTFIIAIDRGEKFLSGLPYPHQKR